MGEIQEMHLSLRQQLQHFETTREQIKEAINEVEILDRALSAEEIQAIFDAGSAGKCKDLILTGPTPGTAGVDNTLEATGATPGAMVHFVFGTNPGSFAVPGCEGKFVDVADPEVIGTAPVDVDGNASVTVAVPSSAAGKTFGLHAVELVACRVSNLVIHAFP